MAARSINLRRTSNKRDASLQTPRNARIIYDVLYGFIPITEWEEKIINSPFFQRLRWIKQLGFANYVFPGAEHNRFAHVIGVMHSMDQMLRSLGLAVSDHELFDRNATSRQAILHKSLRIAALLHDLGTFPLSHAVEYAYIQHGNDLRRMSPEDRAKPLPNSHEHLGSFIIKNTRFSGGITQILESYGFDVRMISKIIKGDSPDLIANQLMHSDLDADRMDYLLRDAHYTGIQYGQFDRDYILANLVTYNAGRGQIGFGVRSNAVHAVEDFLIARYSWYSQVIKHKASAKFDILSTHVAAALLKQDLLYQFHDLLSMIEERDERFFWWNDLYFMNRLQEIRISGRCSDPHLSEQIEMLLYRIPPKTVHDPIFEHKLIGYSDKERAKRVKLVESRVEELKAALKRYGTGREWIIADLPKKDVVFTQPLNQLIKQKRQKGFSHEVGSVKLITKDGEASLLVERPNILMGHLSGLKQFVPNVYANRQALEILKGRHLL